MPRQFLIRISTTNRVTRAWPVSRTRLARARLPLRMLGAILGILLFIHLIHRAGPAKLLASMVALGWGLALVIAWGGVAHILKTWAWRLTLLDGKYQVSFGRMLGLRLSSEAIGSLAAWHSCSAKVCACRCWARQFPSHTVLLQ